MPKSSHLQRQNNDGTSPKSSVSSTHSFSQRVYRRYTKFYENNIIRKLRQTLGGEITTSESPHSGSINSNSYLLPQKRDECTKLLSCLSPRCLRRQMSNTSYKRPSNLNDVDGLEDLHSQSFKMKFHDENSRNPKIEILKREVDQLENELVHEQMLREALKDAHEYEPGHAISIPSFLPPKVKEMLMEISEANIEITRLEGQLSELQVDLACEKELTKDLKSRNTPQGKKRNSTSKSLVKFGNLQRMGNEKVKVKLSELKVDNNEAVIVPILDLGLNLKYV